MKQKILIALTTVVLALASIISILIGLYYWSGFQFASSPDCNLIANMFTLYTCNPSMYIAKAIIWTIVAIVFTAITVVFFCMQINKWWRNKKAKKPSSQPQ